MTLQKDKNMSYIFSGMNVQCALPWVQDNCFVVELIDRVLTATEFVNYNSDLFLMKNISLTPSF